MKLNGNLLNGIFISLTFVGLLMQTRAINLENNCTKFLREYAHTTGLFSNCFLNHAVPARICFNCTDFYKDLVEKYNTFENAVLNNTNGESITCKQIYDNHDQLRILLRYYDYFVNLWNDAACFSCFDSNKLNQSEETKSMIEKLDNLQHCVVQWTSDPCKNCESYYDEMNSYYEKVFINSNKKICYDIRDTLNRTRLLWTRNLKCRNNQRAADFGSFAAVVTCVGCLPAVMFYLLSYYFTKRNESEAIGIAENISNIENEDEDDLSSISNDEPSLHEEGAIGGENTKISSREAPEGMDDINYIKSQIKTAQEPSTDPLIDL